MCIRDRYQAIRAAHGQAAWFDWPRELRDRHQDALAAMRRQFAETVAQCQFEQFLFYRQWAALKQYANERGILIFGDIPLFVGYDSADVWARRDCFLPVSYTHLLTLPCHSNRSVSATRCRGWPISTR